MGTKMIIIIAVAAIVIAVVICLASGGRYERSQHNNDISKYSR